MLTGGSQDKLPLPGFLNTAATTKCWKLKKDNSHISLLINSINWFTIFMCEYICLRMTHIISNILLNRKKAKIEDCSQFLNKFRCCRGIIFCFIILAYLYYLECWPILCWESHFKPFFIRFATLKNLHLDINIVNLWQWWAFIWNSLFWYQCLLAAVILKSAWERNFVPRSSC